MNKVNDYIILLTKIYIKAIFWDELHNSLQIDQFYLWFLLFNSDKGLKNVYFKYHTDWYIKLISNIFIFSENN